MCILEPTLCDPVLGIAVQSAIAWCICSLLSVLPYMPGKLICCRVVNKGVVVEDGSHNQLLEAGGVYSSLVRRQMQKNTSSASLGSLAHTESSTSLRDLLPRH